MIGEGFVNYMNGAGYVLGSDLAGYFGRSQYLMRYYDDDGVTVGAHLGFIKDIFIFFSVSYFKNYYY